MLTALNIPALSLKVTHSAPVPNQGQGESEIGDSGIQESTTRVRNVIIDGGPIRRGPTLQKLQGRVRCAPAGGCWLLSETSPTTRPGFHCRTPESPRHSSAA